MKTGCLLIVLSFAGIVDGQRTKSSPGHTHDILAVKFSPDDSQLLSYSWGDGWLILWEAKSGYLIWRAKTELVQRANERYNLQEFHWSEDGQFVLTKSQNGTHQTWDAKTGELVGVFDKSPDLKLKSQITTRISVKKDSAYFYLLDRATKLDFAGCT